MNDAQKRKELLADVPKKPQRQDSTTAQLLDLIAVGRNARLITDTFLTDQPKTHTNHC